VLRSAASKISLQVVIKQDDRVNLDSLWVPSGQDHPLIHGLSQDFDILFIPCQRVRRFVDIRKQGLACPVSPTHLSGHGEMSAGHLFDALDFGSRDGSAEGLSACKTDVISFGAIRIRGPIYTTHLEQQAPLPRHS